MLPRIGRYPFFGKAFFRRARKIVGPCNFSHLWRVVMCLASMHGRRSLSRIEDLAKRRRTRQAISHFLTQAEWDAPELLRAIALQTLTKLGCRAGEAVYIVLDDTQIEKFGKRMDAVHRIFLHAQKRYAHGHTVVGSALVYRNVVIPYAVSLWTPKTFSGRPFRKSTEMAGDMVRAVELPKGVKPIVLFDAYYLCPAVTDACDTRKFPYVGTSRSNRRFAPDGRPNDARQLKSYGRNVLGRDGRVRTVRDKRYRLAERVGTLRKAGRVKLVFSRRVRETVWRTLVTNHTRWGAKTVLEHYLVRWGIEVLFKMTKQHLGLGDYQLHRYTGVVRYLHLVLIAHLLLTHLAFDAPDAKASLDKNTPLHLKSTLELQAELRGKLWNDAVSKLENSAKYRPAARKLKNCLMFS